VRFNYKVFVLFIASTVIFAAPTSTYAVTSLQEYEGLISRSMTNLSNVPEKATFVITSSQGDSVTRGSVLTDPIDRKSTGVFTVTVPGIPPVTIKNVQMGRTDYSYMNGRLAEKLRSPIAEPMGKSENFFTYMSGVRQISGISYHRETLEGLSGVVDRQNYSIFQSDVSGVSLPQVEARTPVKKADVKIYFNPENGRVHEINIIQYCYQDGVSYTVNETETIKYLTAK